MFITKWFVCGAVFYHFTGDIIYGILGGLLVAVVDSLFFNDKQPINIVLAED